MYASDPPIPATTINKADESDYPEIWRNARVCEFGGLLQATSFESAYQSIDNVIDAKWLEIIRLQNADR